MRQRENGEIKANKSVGGLHYLYAPSKTFQTVKCLCKQSSSQSTDLIYTKPLGIKHISVSLFLNNSHFYLSCSASLMHSV